MSEAKICPLLTLIQMMEPRTAEGHPCIEDKCAWWVGWKRPIYKVDPKTHHANEVTVTEGECAIVAMAKG